MFKNITQFFKRFRKSEKEESKSTAKERLHLVLAQDRANISADFLEMMKQEILEVIKKYIDIDEKAIDVRLTNKEGEDGSVGAPALYANIPIITIKNEARKLEGALKKENADSNTAQEKIEEEKAEKNKQEENKKTEEEHKEEVIEAKKENAEETIKKEKTVEENKEKKKDNENINNKEIEKEQDTLENNKVNEVDDEEKNS